MLIGLRRGCQRPAQRAPGHQESSDEQAQVAGDQACAGCTPRSGDREAAAVFDVDALGEGQAHGADEKQQKARSRDGRLSTPEASRQTDSSDDLDPGKHDGKEVGRNRAHQTARPKEAVVVHDPGELGGLRDLVEAGIDEDAPDDERQGEPT